VQHFVYAALFTIGFTTGVLTMAQRQDAPQGPTERVTGIGGVFFKAKDPKALSAWYHDKLGIQFEKEGLFSLFRWKDHNDATKAGTTVWSLFPATTKYFGPGDSSCMVNYRVANMDRMIAQLKALGVQVDAKIEDDFNGRFASVIDPEGNKIQLWEPKPGY
jgi:predicted enzyme related to lactoylglutathione lyase